MTGIERLPARQNIRVSYGDPFEMALTILDNGSPANLVGTPLVTEITRLDGTTTTWTVTLGGPGVAVLTKPALAVGVYRYLVDWGVISLLAGTITIEGEYAVGDSTPIDRTILIDRGPTEITVNIQSGTGIVGPAGSVDSVTAANTSIIVGGTATDPTVAVDPATRVSPGDLAPAFVRYFDGTASNGWTTPKVAAFDVSSSLDVRSAVTPVSWLAPVGNDVLLAQSGVSADYGWQMYLNAEARPVFSLSTTGLVGGLITISAPDRPQALEGTALCIRAVWNGSVPSVQFYTKPTKAASVLVDIESDDDWVALGAAVTASVPATLFNSSAQMSAAMFSLGGSSPYMGKYLAGLVKIDGATQATIDGRNPSTRVRDEQTRIWTLTGATSSMAAAPLDFSLVLATIGGEAAELLRPARSNGRMIIYHHGLGEIQNGPRTELVKRPLTLALLDAGYSIASSNAHGNSWGSNAAIADYVALHNWAVTIDPADKVVHWSQSMGGPSGLNTIQSGAIPADAWLGIYPVCDLAWAYNQGGSFALTIEAAYGFSGASNYAAATAGHDPVLFPASTWDGLPMRFYASPGDTTVTKANNSDVLAAIATGAAERGVVVCSGNHGDPSHFQIADILAFFDRALI